MARRLPDRFGRRGRFATRHGYFVGFSAAIASANPFRALICGAVAMMSPHDVCCTLERSSGEGAPALGDGLVEGVEGGDLRKCFIGVVSDVVLLEVVGEDIAESHS